MSRLVRRPTVIRAAGVPPKTIREFVGRVNTGTREVSIAQMISPRGWSEPAQRPEFNEYTLVLKGALHVQVEGRTRVVKAGQAILVRAGERVRYSSPGRGGAEYVAVCVPAFSPKTVHREG